MKNIKEKYIEVFFAIILSLIILSIVKANLQADKASQSISNVEEGIENIIEVSNPSMIFDLTVDLFVLTMIIVGIMFFLWFKGRS